MNIVHKRLFSSFVINILIIIIFIISLILEIIDIQTNPTSVYKNIWGLFRFFTIDGNLFSIICCIILSVKQFMILKKSKDENINSLLFSHFNYIIGLMAASVDLLIFIVVMCILVPLSGKEGLNLINTFNASGFHITIPVLLNIRFIFLDNRERDLFIYEKLFGGIPMFLYGIIMLILCISKVFTGYGENGDGKIPYPFLDVYHRNIFVCIFSGIFIFGFGFGIGFLLDFLNKKCQNIICPYNYLNKEDVNKVIELVE